MQTNETRRFHPYAQSRINPSSSASMGRIVSRPASINTQNYDHDSYLNSVKINQRVVYPTLMKSNQERKTALKDRTNTLNNQAKSNARKHETDQNDPNSLKIWSVTTKSLLVFANRFDVIEKNCLNKKISENNLPGSHIFEIIGQLDSTVSKDERKGAKEFSLKDTQGRIHCVFYEIDRELNKLVRDSWIRCVGKYNLKSGLFHCLSVRLVINENELLGFGFQVNQTNAYVKNKFFKP